MELVSNTPEEWQTLPLEKVVIPSGLIRGPFGGSLKKEEFISSGYKVYTQQNAIYQNTELGSYFIGADKYKELNRFSVRPKDCIISCSGTIGKLHELPDKCDDGVINQALLIIRTDDEKIDRSYFKHFFRSKEFQSQIIESTQGGAMQNLVGMEEFKKSTLILPPIKEQRVIAEALSDVDALISSLKKLIEKKQGLKNGLAQKALKGETGLAPIDENWKKVKIGEILTIKHGKDQKSVASSNGLFPILATGGRIGMAKDYLYDKPSVLIGRKGTINKPQYIEEPFWSIDTLFYSELSANVIPKFIYYVFCQIDWMQFNEASGVPSLNSQTIENIEVLIPTNKNAQEKIANALSDFDADIDALVQKYAKIKNLKNGIMQEIFSGRTRLI